MMEMVRGLTALSKREKGGDENGGGEDGGVSGHSGGSSSENREGVERRFKRVGLVLQVICLARELDRFFYGFFSSLFFFFWAKQSAFGIALGKFGPFVRS